MNVEKGGNIFVMMEQRLVDSMESTSHQKIMALKTVMMALTRMEIMVSTRPAGV